MKSATILLKTDPRLKAEAQKLAEQCGVSLNAVLSRSLQVFVRDRSITFADDTHTLVPNVRTANALKGQLRDVSAKKKLSQTFRSASAAIAHLKAVCE